MRPFLLTAAALTVIAAPPAMAQSNSDTRNVSINGNVAPLCVLGAPSSASVDLGLLINISGARVGRMAALANRTINLPGSFCNYANSAIRVDASALLAVDTATPQAGFARAVNFTAAVAPWATTVASVTTAANAAGGTPGASGTGGTQPTPKLADLTLTLSAFTAPSDLLLVASGYAGQVTVTLGPASGQGL